MAPDLYYQKPPDPRLRTGAGGIIVRREQGRLLVALIRTRGDHAYVLPKGGVERGETLEQAAVREVEEEAGLTELTCLGEIGTGERLSGRRNAWQTTHYFLFLTDQVKNHRTERDRWEVGWFDLDDLPPIYWREQAQLLEENRERIRSLVGG